MHTPPFCPNENCTHHNHHKRSRYEKSRVGKWFWLKGKRSSACAGDFQRFQCKHCGRFFTERTFSIDYRVHRIVSYSDLLKDVRSRCSLAATQRNRGISPSIRRNRISRLARNCIALHAELKPYLRKPEDLIADGFVSFEVSQYYPSNLHVVIGKESEYLYAMDHVTIRRTGKMSERQKKQQARLEAVFRPEPRGIVNSFSRVMGTMSDCIEQWKLPEMPTLNMPGAVTFITDNKLEYPIAIGICERLHTQIASSKVNWKTISSDHHRGPGGPMFAMDNFDRELRKDIAAYVRETVTFRRNVVNAMESAQVYRMYHNFMKPYRSRGKSKERRWQRVGLPEKIVRSRLKKMFTQRAFLSHLTAVPEEDERIWKRQLYTPGQLSQKLPPKYILN
ncbi:hypothetical protein [Spirochaeta dissipatitropha]